MLEALEPPEGLTVSQWAEKNRVLDMVNCAEPGPWRNERTPYLVEPMDALSEDGVEWVVEAFAAQLGKTELILNFCGFAATEDPGPMLLVYPRQRDAEKIVKQRLHSAILESDAWRRELRVSSSDALQVGAIEYQRSKLDTAWSNSPAALSSTPYRYVLFDETGKFPKFSGKDANPIALGAKRTSTFRHRRKIVLVSTPLEPGDFVWTHLQRSAVYQFYVPCPRCGGFQTLDFFKGLKWPKDVYKDEIEERNLAYYVCRHCEEHLKETEKPQMLARGKWIYVGGPASSGEVVIDSSGKNRWDGPRQRIKEGRIVGPGPRSRRRLGYHLNALYSPWETWSGCAFQFLSTKEDEGARMEFWNQWLALPWEKRLETIAESLLLARKKDFPSGIVPFGGQLLCAFVDVQEHSFWFVVRAFGFGERSWLIDHGQLATWKDVEKKLATEYEMAGGGTMAIRRALIDSGNKPSAVYEFAKLHRPMCWPSKGSGNISMTIKVGNPEPGTALYTYRVDHFKDKLARLLQIADGDPGDWRLPVDVSDEYILQMQSEQRIRKLVGGRVYYRWETVSDNNHLWDCEVGVLVAADLEGVRFMTAEGGPPAREESREESTRSNSERDDFELPPDEDFLSDDLFQG